MLQVGQFFKSKANLSSLNQSNNHRHTTEVRFFIKNPYFVQLKMWFNRVKTPHQKKPFQKLGEIKMSVECVIKVSLYSKPNLTTQLTSWVRNKRNHLNLCWPPRPERVESTLSRPLFVEVRDSFSLSPRLCGRIATVAAAATGRYRDIPSYLFTTPPCTWWVYTRATS